MKRKLTVILDDEAFRKVAGTLFSTGADFTVETSDEPQPRHVQRVTTDGKTAGEILLETVLLKPHRKIHSSEFKVIGKYHGFAPSTISGAATKLVEGNLLRKEGMWYIATEGAKRETQGDLALVAGGK